MNEIEKTLIKELNDIVRTESLGKYHSLDEIPLVNSAICTMKIGITLLLGLMVALLISNSSPLLLLFGFFPYSEAMVIFSNVMEYTLLLCMVAILVYFSRKSCKDNNELEIKILKGSFVTPTPELMKAYRDARTQMENSGIICDDWEHKNLIRISEIEQFITQYQKH